MKVFVIGVSGAIGGRLADKLQTRGAEVGGLVRTRTQQADLAARGVDAVLGELSKLSARQLADALAGSDALVYAAGSNGGAREVTKAIDGEGSRRPCRRRRWPASPGSDWSRCSPSRGASATTARRSSTTSRSRSSPTSRAPAATWTGWSRSSSDRESGGRSSSSTGATPRFARPFRPTFDTADGPCPDRPAAGARRRTRGARP